MKEKEKNIGTVLLNEGIEFAKTLGTSVIIAAVLVHFFIRPIRVDGSSMYPTLETDSLGISNVLGIRLGHLERFDIAIIYLKDEGKYLVKRVIGLPGETVSYQDGKLYIDGNMMSEDFLDRDYVESYDGIFMKDVEEITLGEDEYFCLGDNRPRSKDSRFYGPFKKEQIRCKGALIIYPFSDFGLKAW